MHCRHVQARTDTRKNILNLLLLLLLCKLPKSPVPLKPAGVEGILDLGRTWIPGSFYPSSGLQVFKSTGQMLLSPLRQKELL